MIIEKINGITIDPGMDFSPLLNHRAGQPTLLSIFDVAKNLRFDVTVKPISTADQDELLYQRWVKRRRELVDKLSNGTVGYVHVRGMNDESFRETYSEALGRESSKKALIVDTRFNGGGNLHDALATFLSGKPYLEFLPTRPEHRLGTERKMAPEKRGSGRREQLLRRPFVSLGLPTFRDRQAGRHARSRAPAPLSGGRLLQDPRLIFGIPEIGFPGRKGSVHGKDSSGAGHQSAQRRKEHRRRQRPADRKSGRVPDAGLSRQDPADSEIIF